MNRRRQTLAVILAMLLVSASVTPTLSLSPTVAASTTSSTIEAETTGQTQASALVLKQDAIAVLNNSTLVGPPGQNPGNGPPENPGNGPGSPTTTAATATPTDETTTESTPGPPDNPGNGNGPGKTTTTETSRPTTTKTSTTPDTPTSTTSRATTTEASTTTDTPTSTTPPATTTDQTTTKSTRGPPENPGKGNGPGNGNGNGPHSASQASADRGPGTGNGNSKVKEKRLATLNATLSNFTDSERVSNVSVFEADKQVAAAVQSHAPNVTELLADSNQRLAETALADARHVRTTLNERALSYDEHAVSAELETATAALDRAEKMRSKDNLVGAMAQYREAWLAAQRALDRMDRAVEPQVAITTREDPRHGQAIEYTVRGEIFDVRVHDLQNVTLTVDGEEMTSTVSTPTKPGTNATFEATVTLSTDSHSLGVRATDPGQNYATTDDEEFPVVVQHGSDTLHLDGDRLRDHFELRRSLTDPLDHNSSSTGTNRTESANATPDDREDLDRDNATNYAEQRADSDPLDPDTDDDRLRDGFEIRHENISPLDTDTDGNGTGDAEEDLEPDGLTNIREQNYSTDPNDPDTDDDGLQDGPEVDEYGTEPLDPDTDGDELQDGSEVNKYGTDPLDLDTDGEGLDDGAEVTEYGTDPLDPDTDSEGLNDSAEVHQYGTDPLDSDTDGDGLNDSEEVHKYGTDPLDADSDGDGLEDGPEVTEYQTDPLDVDTDGDELEDGPEVHEYETDPLDPDTDNEGLTDAEEVREFGTDPLDPDTDDDRLTDAAELREYGTKPLVRDTDEDGLDDGAEVLDHGTDPLDTDTDDDELNDSEELDLPTDPLVADTDGDTTLDGNETFTTSKTDNETGVSVNVTGEGNVAATVSVNNSSQELLENDAVDTVTVSNTYEFEAETNFSTANITLPYNESRVESENESGLGAYRYNETLQTFVPVNNSTVDAVNDTVTAETPHFRRTPFFQLKNGNPTLTSRSHRSGQLQIISATLTSGTKMATFRRRWKQPSTPVRSRHGMDNRTTGTRPL